MFIRLQDLNFSFIITILSTSLAIGILYRNPCAAFRTYGMQCDVSPQARHSKQVGKKCQYSKQVRISSNPRCLADNVDRCIQPVDSQQDPCHCCQRAVGHQCHSHLLTDGDQFPLILSVQQIIMILHGSKRCPPMVSSMDVS